MSAKSTAELVAHLESLGILLEADGDRLRVNAPKGALTPELTGELRERKQEILDQVREARRSDTPPPLTPRERDGRLPLSFSQQRLWFLHQMEPGSPLYTVSAGARLRGRLDEAALERALAEIVRRHESMRTSFEAREGRPAQVVAESVEVTLRRVDLSDLSPGQREESLRSVAREEVRRPFDIARPPLWRLVLVRLAEHDHVLLFTIHHIISDDWSGGVFVSELSALYAAFVEDRPSPLPQLPVQYADFAIWQREWLSGTVLERQLSYWRERLGDDLPVLDLPTDRPRPAVQGDKGDIVPVTLDGDLSRRLEELCRQAGATAYMGLMAAFQALLARISGQHGFGVGMPIANRTRSEIEGLIGLFVNTLVMRADLADDPTFANLLKRVRDDALGAYDHQDLPFEKLVEELSPERDLSHSPLFQAMLILETGSSRGAEMAGLEVAPVGDIHPGIAKVDLSLYLERADDGYEGFLEYATDLFDRASAERIVTMFQTLIGSVTAAPRRRVSELEIMPAGERARVLRALDGGTGRPAAADTLHGLFAAQAQETPDAVALEFEGRELSYRQLDRRARRLAHHLRELGVGPEVPVGIYLERGPGMLTALLGVLYAGGAYLPLDPSYPAERLGFMVDSSGARVVLTERDLADSLPGEGARAVELDGAIAARLDEAGRAEAEPPRLDDLTGPGNLAYMIYTSGSTGRPKGVMIEHASAVNFLRAMARDPGLGADDRLLAVTTLSFDISVLELFLPLTVGARVVLASRQVAGDGERLAAAIRESKATVMQATPATWHLLLARGDAALPPRVLCGGEALSGELADQLLARGAQLTNLYGPTEATVWASLHPVSERRGTVPIGRPIDNVRMVILDRHLEPVPVGVTGELYIGGVQVARGYRDRPDLTAERFLPDPFAGEPGSRIYHTGDLARLRADGTVEFLGRSDHQVKVRGFRIELGEIEAVLDAHPQVRRVVLTARHEGGGDSRLVAYLVAEPPAPTVTELRRHLRDHLPEYMVPGSFVFMDAFPLLPNGKVDRKALPEPDGERPDLEQAYVEPSTPVERAIAAVWRDAIGTDRVGIYDNFFDLGGHSLLAMEVVAKLEGRIGLLLHPADMFTQTLGQLAAAAEERGARAQGGEESGGSDPDDAAAEAKGLGRKLLDAVRKKG